MRAPSRTIAWSVIVSLLLLAIAWTLRPTDDGDEDVFGPDPASAATGGNPVAGGDAHGSAPGDASVRELLVDPGAESPHAMDARAYGLTGRVLNRAGQPIDSRDLWLRCEGGYGEEPSVTVEDDSSYVVEGLAPGSWLVRAGGRQWRRWAKEILIEPEEYETRLDVVLEPLVELRIKVVTSDGRALPPLLTEGEHGLVSANGVEKILQPVALRRPPPTTFLDREDPDVLPFEEARYRLNGYEGVRLSPEYLGVLVLERDLPVYVGLVLHGQILDARLVDREDQDVEFVFDPEDLVALTSTLRARFVEAATGEPVTYRYVMFVGWNFSAKLELDEEGRVEAQRWPPGAASLIVGAPGFEQYREEFVVPPSTTVDLGTIALNPVTWISGTATHRDGKPVGAGSVNCRPFHTKSAMHSAFAVGAGVEEGTGEFLVEVARGLHLLNVKLWDGQRGELLSRNIVVDTTNGSVEGLQVEVAPPLPVTIGADDALPEGVRYRILDDQGIETRVGTLPAGTSERVHLPPGRYSLEVRNVDGGLRQQESFEVGSEALSLTVDS